MKIIEAHIKLGLNGEFPDKYQTVGSQKPKGFCSYLHFTESDSFIVNKSDSISYMCRFVKTFSSLSHLS